MDDTLFLELSYKDTIYRERLIINFKIGNAPRLSSSIIATKQVQNKFIIILYTCPLFIIQQLDNNVKDRIRHKILENNVKDTRIRHKILETKIHHVYQIIDFQLSH